MQNKGPWAGKRSQVGSEENVIVGDQEDSDDRASRDDEGEEKGERMEEEEEKEEKKNNIGRNLSDSWLRLG